MKKIIILVLAACLPLSATAGKKFKINPAAIKYAVEKIGLSTIEEQVTADLAALSKLESYQRSLDRFPDLLPNLSMLGYTSSKYLPEIEEAYKLFQDKPAEAPLEVLALRTALRHGEYDFMNRFQAEYEISDEAMGLANQVAREYGALTTSHFPIFIPGQNSRTQNHLNEWQDDLTTQAPDWMLTTTLNHFGHKYTRAWLPEKGSPEHQNLIRLAKEQHDNPRYYVERTQKLISLLDKTDNLLTSTTLEDPLKYFIYRDTDLPPAHRQAVVKSFLHRYELLNDEFSTQLTFHKDNLQKYVDNPKMFSMEAINKEAQQWRAEALAERAKLVAFMQHNMTGGTSLQREVYDAFSQLADYYRFLQRARIDVPKEFRGEYSLSGVFAPETFGRRFEENNGNWAYGFLYDNNSVAFTIEGISDQPEKNVRSQAKDLRNKLNSYLPGVFEKANNPMRWDEWKKIALEPADPGRIFIAMHYLSAQEKSIITEQRYITYFFTAAYARQVLLDELPLIELDAQGTHPLPNAAFAQQRCNSVQVALEWVKEVGEMVYPSGGTGLYTLYDLLREVERYW
ncbi:MAG: hypothetical protein J5601_03115, partial [Elusimicrobiaceae bacterium]|nr:hypothetical protein [Elusimicrobiaceae bacterium]